MKTIQLGKTGINVKKLGFGAMYLPRIIPGRVGPAARPGRWSSGINYFDTASAYMDSEEKLGRVLSKREKDFTIMTRSISWRTGIDDLKKDFAQSFARLNVETIDFYGFHAVNQPPELDLVMKEPLDYLKEQKARGRIKHIAITGHNPKTLTTALQTGEFEHGDVPVQCDRAGAAPGAYRDGQCDGRGHLHHEAAGRRGH